MAMAVGALGFGVGGPHSGPNQDINNANGRLFLPVNCTPVELDNEDLGRRLMTTMLQPSSIDILFRPCLQKVRNESRLQ